MDDVRHKNCGLFSLSPERLGESVGDVIIFRKSGQNRTDFPARSCVAKDFPARRAYLVGVIASSILYLASARSWY